jgi:hypothetical protein
MKRKPQARPETVISPEIVESAKRSFMTERVKAPVKCIVCASETPAGAAEPLCWVCRRLKISAWRDVEQQIPAQE